LRYIPTRERPFRHLVMDYVGMVKKVNGKTFILVVIDRFSKWVETAPSKEQSAVTVIRFLTDGDMFRQWFTVDSENSKTSDIEATYQTGVRLCVSSSVKENYGKGEWDTQDKGKQYVQVLL